MFREALGEIVKFRKVLMAAVFIVASGIPAQAASNAEPGWTVQFHHDAFAGRTFPVGKVVEKTEGMSIDPALVFLVCTAGSPRVGFQASAMTFGNDVVARFKGSDGIEEVRFVSTEVEGFGGNKIADAKPSEALIGIFSKSNAPVPYQTDKKSGVFPIIGFEETLEIMKQGCATK